MSEVEQKVFKIKKTIPGNVLFILHPVSNPLLTKEIYLTDKRPFQYLPLDWAMGIFVDDGNMKLYEKGMFTFENNDELVKAAYAKGYYFGEVLEFTPAKEDNEKEILAILMSGNRQSINKAITDNGKDMIIQVAAAHINELNTGVVRMLEGMLKVQLTIDNDMVEEK